LMSGFTPSYADITITALSDFAFSVVFCSLTHYTCIMPLRQSRFWNSEKAL
jgi:hypothetical protein